MNKIARAYDAVPQNMAGTVRPSLEGTLGILSDRIEYLRKQIDELEQQLSTVLMPDPPEIVPPAPISPKQESEMLPAAIDHVIRLGSSMDFANNKLESIKNRLCL